MDRLKSREMVKIKGFVFTIIFFASLSCSYAQDMAGLQAQEEAMNKLEPPKSKLIPEYRQKIRDVVIEEEAPLPREIDSYVRYMGSSGAKAQSGHVGVVDSMMENTNQVKLFGKLPVEFITGLRYIGIENDTVVKLPSHLTAVSLGIGTTLPLFGIEKTYFSFALAPSFFTDNWNFHSSSFRLPQRYFLIYQPDKKWTFVCGVAVYPDFDEEVLPIVGFIYKPNEKLTFNLIPRRPEISYALNKKLKVFVEADMSGAEFEVTKDGSENVVLRYDEMHSGAGLRYKFNKNITASLSAGGMFRRSIKYKDSLGKVDIKDCFYTEFRLVISI